MANELRVRALAVKGVVDDNPLAIGAVTLNSANLAFLPAIGATQHLAITLDPDRAGGAPEVVWVTAHAAGAASATILRGQEGTVARAHNQNVGWVHGPTLWDFEKPRVRCKRTADQAIGAAGWTAVSWDAEDVDTHAMHDIAGSPTVVAIVRPGAYRVTSNLHAPGNVVVGSRLKVNGAIGAVGGKVLPSIVVGNAGVGQGAAFSTLLRLVTGDTLVNEIYVGAASSVESDHSSFEVELATMGEL